jgi:hypothetical protein
MINSNFRRHVIPALVIASAAAFGITAGAAAAEPTSSDPQEQARQLLAPTKPSRPVELSESSALASVVVESVLDPQERARRLLAGAHRYEKTALAAPAISTARLDRDTVPGDSQALAQRMILGARGAAKTHAATTAAAQSRNLLE